MSGWLGRQRKPELVALAERAGLDDFEGLRKEELVSVLDEHLHKHSSRLSGDDFFEEYYSRASPAKRAASGAHAPGASDGEIKPRKKRAPKVKDETDANDSPGSPHPAITPAPARSALSPSSARTPSAATTLVKTFPPSPAVVTDAIDEQARRVGTNLTQALAATNLRSTLHDVREMLSSVVGIESAVLLLEAFHLQRQVVPWRHAFDLPPVDALGTDSIPVRLPDLFILLTGVYWSTTLLWAALSFALPLAASWLCNLTIRPVALRSGRTEARPRCRCDPLVFNVAKALLAWSVYAHRARLGGLFADETVLAVQRSMPGGLQGVLVGAAVGALASLYDAAQRK